MIWGLLLLALLLANVPFFNERLLGLIALKASHKHIGWRMLEMVVFYILVGGCAYFFEMQQGPVHSQKWQFYIATFCLFLVFGFPGFVMRYLAKDRQSR
jgi:hypothetical protein